MPRQFVSAVRCSAAAAILLILTAVTGSEGHAATTYDLGLIDPTTVQANRGAWVLLDARPKTDWLSGHIPGARSFSWKDHTGTGGNPLRYRLRPLPEIAAALGDLGIDETTPVVVYGDADKSWGGEGWAVWVLQLLGHRGPIRLLDGGVRRWRTAGFPLHQGPENRPRRGVYHLVPQPQSDVSLREMLRLRGKAQIVDVRSSFERLFGRIPDSVHIPWEKFFTGPDRRPIPRERLIGLLEESGLDPKRPVVYYCTGGIRSAYAWMVHELAGLSGARSFSGGMEEWRQSRRTEERRVTEKVKLR